MKRKSLSAEKIAEAALKYIDGKGLSAFNFRTLAHILGCEAMSIYHYYPSKAHLFDAMIDRCIREMQLAPETDPWLDRMRQMCREFRAMALRHPGFFPFFAVHRLNTPTALAVLNRILKVFEATGLDAETRARHFRVIGYFITGAALDETSGYAKGPSAAEPVPGDVAAREFPSIMAAGPYFNKAYHQKIFDEGLETLLRKIAEDAGVR
ncbi:MAG: TetR/AcrR family transcriptional regulator [Aestuariivirga sp.]